MFGTRHRLARTMLVVGAVLLSTFVAATPAMATGEPLEVWTDCFGTPINRWTVLGVPAGGADFHGTSGNDVIIGTDGSDRIYGGGGQDVICAGGGHDDVFGEDGNDDIMGEAGVDNLEGGDGNDAIYGGPTGDHSWYETLVGGDGIDVLYGQGGRDYMYCGEDWLSGWDVGDFADGGTGMGSTGDPEDDWLVGGCDTSTNFEHEF